MAGPSAEGLLRHTSDNTQDPLGPENPATRSTTAPTTDNEGQAPVAVPALPRPAKLLIPHRLAEPGSDPALHDSACSFLPWPAPWKELHSGLSSRSLNLSSLASRLSQRSDLPDCDGQPAAGGAYRSVLLCDSSSSTLQGTGSLYPSPFAQRYTAPTVHVPSRLGSSSGPVPDPREPPPQDTAHLTDAATHPDQEPPGTHPPSHPPRSTLKLPTSAEPLTMADAQTEITRADAPYCRWSHSSMDHASFATGKLLAYGSDTDSSSDVSPLTTLDLSPIEDCERDGDGMVEIRLEEELAMGGCGDLLRVPYVSPLGPRTTISIKINTSHEVTDLPKDTAGRLEKLLCLLPASGASNGPVIVSNLAVRPGCVRIVLEASRLPRRTQPAALAPPGAVAVPELPEGPLADEEVSQPLADYERLALQVVETLGLDATQLSHQDHVDIQVDGMMVRVTWDATAHKWQASCSTLDEPGMPGHTVQACFADEPSAQLILATHPPLGGAPLAVESQIVVNCVVLHSAGVEITGYAPPSAGHERDALSPAAVAPPAAAPTSGRRRELQVLVQMQGGYVATRVTQHSGELSISNLNVSGPTSQQSQQDEQQMAALVVTAEIPSSLSPSLSAPTWCKVELWCEGLLLDAATLLLGPAQVPPAPRLLPGAPPQPPQLWNPDAPRLVSAVPPSYDMAGASHQQQLQHQQQHMSPGALRRGQHGSMRAKHPSGSVARWLTGAHGAEAAHGGPASHLNHRAQQGAAFALSPSQSLTTSQLPFNRQGFLIDSLSNNLIPSASEREALRGKGVQQRVREAWRGVPSPTLSSQVHDPTGRAAFLADLASWESMLGDSEAQIFMEAVAASNGGPVAGGPTGSSGFCGTLDSSPLLRMSLSPSLLSHAAVLAKALLSHAVRHGMRGIARQLMLGMQSPAGQRLLSSCSAAAAAGAGADSACGLRSSNALSQSPLRAVIDVPEATLLQELAQSSGDKTLVEEVSAWLKLQGLGTVARQQEEVTSGSLGRVYSALSGLGSQALSVASRASLPQLSSHDALWGAPASAGGAPRGAVGFHRGANHQLPMSWRMCLIAVLIALAARWEGDLTITLPVRSLAWSLLVLTIPVLVLAAALPAASNKAGGRDAGARTSGSSILALVAGLAGLKLAGVVAVACGVVADPLASQGFSLEGHLLADLTLSPLILGAAANVPWAHIVLWQVSSLAAIGALALSASAHAWVGVYHVALAAVTGVTLPAFLHAQGS